MKLITMTLAAPLLALAAPLALTATPALADDTTDVSKIPVCTKTLQDKCINRDARDKALREAGVAKKHHHKVAKAK